jgi:trypsin
MPRRLACLLGALAALISCAPAAASQRIIGGNPAAAGEYPAQGFLEFNGFVCGGSLVSNRYFLTAAHCATAVGTTDPVDPAAFTVTLGKLRQTDFEPSDEFSVDENQVHAQYALVGPDDTPNHDIALLRLAEQAPAEFEPLRLIEADETDLWGPGRTATIIGWGTTGGSSLSNSLLEARVPMTSDASCASVWGSSFNAASMVCAGGGDTDTCGGDSGGPLLVGDGAFLVLAGLTSWGANPCAEEGVPGVYTRVGDPDLNAWVRDRVPMARATVSDAAPDPGQPVTFSVTATNPGISAFSTFEWDFDSDGDVDATGDSVTHAYPDDADVVARVVAKGSGPDTATDKLALRVGDPTPTPTATPTPTPTASATPAPSPAVQQPPPAAPRPVVASGPLASILVTGRPRVRNGRFTIRVRFAPTAPPRTAVVEAIRNRRVIGIARTTVLQGGTKRLRVKLTPRGRRLLSRSSTRRLRLKVRVRVGRQVLRTRIVTVRR